MKDISVLTIDGPSGVGKGTISFNVAEALNWHYLDSGALYRLVAFGSLKHGITFDDKNKLADYAAQLDVQFTLNVNSRTVDIVLENQQVNDLIRTEEMGGFASQVAAVPEVRTALLARQRAFCQPPGLVADGRDMGTVVFPQAKLKIFLIASAEERAQRRHKQLIEKGIDANLRNLVEAICERDERDSTRSTAPLIPADDAHTIDTTCLTIEQVTQTVLKLCNENIASAKTNA